MVGLVNKLIDVAELRRAEVVRITVGRVADCNTLYKASAYAGLLICSLLVSYELGYRSGTWLAPKISVTAPTRRPVRQRACQTCKDV